MKRFFIITLFLITGFCFAQQDSDVQIFNNLRQSYKNGFFPGVVTAADTLQSDFPESAFIHSALAFKGEALINMESYDEAILTLESAISFMHSGTPELIRCNYLLGRAFFAKKQFSVSLEKFHTACRLALLNNDMDFYASSVLGSARDFYILEKWNDAVPLFEYVISNGKLFEAADYNEALQKLFVSYNKSGSPVKTTELFNKLSDDDFEPSVFMTLCFYYADANAALKNNQEAYNAYCRVLESGEKSLAVSALKKAYLISSENGIGDSGEILSKTRESFSDTPELLNEFWLRLAIDEFGSGDFGKAQDYLSNIEISEYEENEGVRLLKSIYEAKILLETGDASSAEKKLSGLEAVAKKSQVAGACDSYYSTLLQCKIQNKKWDEVPGIYGKIKQPEAADKYAVSSYYYQKGQFDKVDSSCGELYASALCRAGHYEEACSEYERLGLISLDYALALFRCVRYDESEKVAASGTSPQKDYVRGLCYINKKMWKSAAECFATYLREMSGSSDFNKLSLYYKGYAEYNLAQFKDSYSSFVRYCLENQNSVTAYVLRSYEYAVKSALQNGDFKNASIQSANLVRYSTEKEQKEKAIILSAEIFSDYGNYDSALELLTPYMAGRDEFAAQSTFMAAGIYARQGKASQADLLYRRIYEEMSKSSFAEEAMYRTGEVYYFIEDYPSAFSRFNNYIYKYASGKFSDAAMFYCADCALRLGENDRCVMLNRTLLQKFPASVYVYGANKNLLEAYYKQENYSQALEVAKVLQRDFNQQASDDDIENRIKELEKIVNGTDRRVAEKESEFIKLGEVETLEGRNSGTELVKMYAESLYTQREAYELAEKLLARQTGGEERGQAAYNAEFIAEYSRKNGENKKAAQMYLKAAEYYRSVKNEGGAAAALYGAAEAFAADGLIGDARETASLLKELYPESIQAERVDRVTGDARN